MVDDNCIDCSYKYREKHKKNKESFLMKERYVKLGHKKLSLGSFGNISLQLTTLPDELGEEMRQRNLLSVTQKEMPTEHEFTGFRESFLNEMPVL